MAQGAHFVDTPELFEQLFVSLPDAILLVDSHGGIREANPQVERLFGYSGDELIGSSVDALIPERFRGVHPKHRSDYAGHPRMRAMGAGFELYGKRKDGTEFPVDILLSPVTTAEGHFVLCVIRDITERKNAEQSVRRSEEQLRSIINSIEDYAILMLDPEGCITAWNSGAETIKGYNAEEIIGRNFSCFYTDEDIARGKPNEALRAAASSGRYEDEGWRIRKDGSRFWADVIVSAVKDKEHRLLGFSKVTRDVTLRKTTEDALMQELSKSILSRFDLRNLLSALSASIRQVIPHDFATIALHDRNSDELRVHALDFQAADSVTGDIMVPIAGSASGFVVTNREPLLLNDFQDSRFDLKTFQYLKNRGMTSACWVPLVDQDRIFGTLMVARKTSGFTPRDLEALGHFANQAAIGIDNFVAAGELKQLSEKLAEEKEHLEQELRVLEEDLNLEYRFDEMVGESNALKRVLKQVENVATTDATVLILGETGTGKELVARAIHQLSQRRERSIMKVNCAAIPGGLLESELFGHERGAFTGAISQKIGRLELANRGTLFLDEVGDLPLELQPKLLRAIQEKEFERLGSARTIPVDVRLIAATNRDLSKMVADKEFRSDLYYRLRVFPIQIPPLRERREDIPLLARYFVDKHARRMNREITSIPDDVMRALTHWSWPGNIRELENFIERAVILSKGPALRAPLAELSDSVSEEAPAQENDNLEATEREHILKVLREAHGMIGGPDGAATRLGLKRTTLNSKLKKLKILKADYST